jgi:hypothetical protein
VRVLAFVTTIALAALAAAAAAGPLDALQGTTPEQRASLQTAYMKEHLPLSGELLERVTALNLKAAKGVQPILDGHDGTFGKIEALRAAEKKKKKKEAELEKLLPAEKYARYLDSKSELKAYVKAGLAKQKAGK